MPRTQLMQYTVWRLRTDDPTTRHWQICYGNRILMDWWFKAGDEEFVIQQITARYGPVHLIG